uniref:Uncharacterized protein n=1 Tax=Anguilla anguilla TaxID=7936 RepID=A0A0E9PGR5_ANGAN
MLNGIRKVQNRPGFMYSLTDGK